MTDVRRHPGRGERGRDLFRTVGLLLLVPVAISVLGITIKNSLGPFWIGTNYDPDCLYLFAALNLTDLVAPGYVAHPGTPLAGLLALVLKGTHVIAGQGTLVTDVLTRTQLYMDALVYALMSFSAIVLVVSGAYVLRRSGSVPIALLVQTSPLLSYHCFARIPRIMAETFLLVVSTVIGATIIAYVYRTDVEDEGHFPEIFGVLIGLAVASKVNAVPLALLPLLVMRGWRPCARYVATAGISFFIFILPVILGGHWRELGHWIGSIISHTGLYGKGSAGVIDPLLYIEAIRDLLKNEASLIAVFFLSVATLLWSRGKETEFTSQKRFKLLRRSLFATVCVQILQVILVAKHPANRYLVPVLGLLGMNLALMVGLVREHEEPLGKSFGTLLAVVSSASIIAFQIPQYMWLSSALEGHAAAQQCTAREVDRYSNCTVVESFGFSSVPLALFIGDSQGGSRYGSILAKMYPKFKYFNCKKGVRKFSGEEISLEHLLASDDDVIFCGSTLENEECVSKHVDLLYEPPQSGPVYYAVAKLYRLRKGSRHISRNKPY